MNPRVTIIIPFYNCRFVALAIQSALRQTYSNVEIIVIDDGSTKYARLINPFRHRIHYLGKANGGTATALNHGIHYASGDYIAWLSSDDLFYRNKILHQVGFMIEREAPISYTNFNYINSSGAITSRGVCGATRSPRQLYESFLTGNPVNGCTVMIRKDVFQHIGGFDESLPYTHDYDFWMRAALSGLYFPYLEKNLTAYRWHPGMGSVRHSAVITQEIEQVRSKYAGAMQQLVSITPG
ncbi:glycosyltransferase involved in cell wall biosynthesis [Paenibacillus shirakamiensis]|uniref:Glycosyltransferase involved in cell wall biosynthesis n=1 Tax=Paenibacillus shirakamiensis TaxID=1265935 RepID=A0ABS4JM10_9BACL|nr:glycosyltransferase [Paenibacillus shirakamiensis]MBP2002141.1 glycosyltransferase involved in cell wall biosynthesis [Paenibacillus shirakamiensis]